MTGVQTCALPISPPAFVLSQDQTLRTKTKTSKPRKTHHTTTAQQAIPTKNNSKTKNRHKKQTHYRVHKQHPTPNHNTQKGTTTRQGNHHNPTTRAAATKHKPTHPHPPTSNPHNVTPTTLPANPKQTRHLAPFRQPLHTTQITTSKGQNKIGRAHV